MATFIHKGRVEETLATLPTQGKRLLEPLKSFSLGEKVPMHILEDVEVANDAEVHRHEADLWHCLSGEVTFVCGGEMVHPTVGGDDREIKAKEIRGGQEIALTAGDWLFIPAGEPHLHKAEGTARLIIIKIPQAVVPLEAVPGWR